MFPYVLFDGRRLTKREVYMWLVSYYTFYPGVIDFISHYTYSKLVSMLYDALIRSVGDIPSRYRFVNLNNK